MLKGADKTYKQLVRIRYLAGALSSIGGDIARIGDALAWQLASRMEDAPIAECGRTVMNQYFPADPHAAKT
jgi:hypothetical protein